MSRSVNESSLAHAREAMDRGAWGEAYELLSQADRERGLDPDELPVLADSAYLAGHPDVSRNSWERIHSAALEAGDTVAAGEAAVRLAAYYLDAVLYAPLRAWLERAESLLEGQEDTPAHGMLAWVASYEAVAQGDHEASLRWARRAVEIGTKLGDKASLAMGRICEGRGLVMAGHVREGLALLDEAVVAGTAGDLDAYTTSVVYCVAICTWQALTEYERAEEWTEGMHRWCSTHDVGGMHGRCRVHRAQLLRLRGRS
jgi:hypothetical protein